VDWAALAFLALERVTLVMTGGGLLILAGVAVASTGRAPVPQRRTLSSPDPAGQ
jgi:hypothetical protein